MSPRSYQQLVRAMNRVIDDAELAIKIARDQVDKPSSKSKMRKATEKDIFPGATLILKTADLGGNERMVYVFPVSHATGRLMRFEEEDGSVISGINCYVKA